MTTPRAYRRQAEATDDKCAALEAQLAEARADIERLRFTGFIGGEMRTQEHALALDKMRADLEAARAQAAQMREALEKRCPDHHLNHMDGMGCRYTPRELAALSSDAGRGYVSAEKHEAGLREAWDAGAKFGVLSQTQAAQKFDTREARLEFITHNRDADVARILKGGGK